MPMHGMSRSISTGKGDVQVPQVAPPNIEIPPPLEVVEVATNATTRGRATPSVAMETAIFQLAAPASLPSTMLGLVASSTTLDPGVAKVSTLVLPNAAVTLDAALTKRMVDFIIQPRDHRERRANSWR